MFKKAMLPTPFRSITTEAALAHNPQKDIEPQCTLILPSISGNSKSIGRNSRRYFFLSPLVKSLGGGQAAEETRLKQFNPLLTLRYRPLHVASRMHLFYFRFFCAFIFSMSSRIHSSCVSLLLRISRNSLLNKCFITNSFGAYCC